MPESQINMKSGIDVDSDVSAATSDAQLDRITDTTLAHNLAQFLVGQAQYWREADRWLLWDGKHWSVDTPGGLFPIIDKHINDLIMKLAKSEKTSTDTRFRNFREFCRYEQHARKEQLIKALSVIPTLIAESHRLDAQPMLLNCLNGTINLSDGKLQEHDPADMITMLCPLEYDQDALCPIFMSFLGRIFAGNAELIGYIRRLAGYCLTGRTDEQIMPFFYGTGRNGKTTLINVLLMLLDKFASSAQADLLMMKNTSGANNELARLRGARVVAVNEVEEGARLAEAQLKTLTGGDKVTARFLFKEYFEYVPQFKLILVGNHKPQIYGRDLGIWRRIHLVPFDVTIPESECDPKLMDKFVAEMQGIFAWAVAGCIEWQRVGLNPPESIMVSTAKYRKAEDSFENWLRECCETRPELVGRPQELLESFVKYSGRSMTPTKLGRLLNEAGFESCSNGRERFWLGIKLR